MSGSSDNSGSSNDEFARKIFVTGLPQGVTESSVTIHFRKKENRGGEIERVTLLSGGKAFIFFEDPEVAKTVANTVQIFEGKELEVKRLGTETSEKAELRQEKRNERNEPKTILVSGLPEGSTSSSVHIHFQKKKNGGGEIEKVELLGQGKAIVVFEDSRVAKTVANTEQIFDGKELEVKLGTDALKNMEKLKNEKHDERNETKTILVSDLPEGSTSSSVHIHFQKKKNGGGEIEKVELLGQGKAIVVFENSRLAKTVANTEQIFKGKELEVKLGTDVLKNMEELKNEKRDGENETKTISVSGLPKGSAENSVHIHFQKKKNGGGEIEKVELLGQGKAIVVFEDPQVAKTVANTEQKFKGKKLEVKLGTDALKNMEELSNEKRDGENETKTILVSGLPEGSTESSVHIHFQKNKNGGGEIEKVEMLEQGKANVVFEDPQVAKQVVKIEHIFKGEFLHVELVEMETHMTEETSEKARFSVKTPGLAHYANCAAAAEEPFSANFDPTSGSYGKKSNDDECAICLNKFTKKKTLGKCGHSFCTKCIDRAFQTQKQCPVCSTVYGTLIGNQPKGNMFDSFQPLSLPGFGSCGTIVICYRFPSGIQGPEHPNPGKPYTGTSRTAYLPDNKEGRKVLRLLKKAFDQKVTFTIGRSVTTGRDDCVIWNDIHHKTSTVGGPTCYGYPDPDYLKRVTDELSAKGITE